MESFKFDKIFLFIILLTCTGIVSCKKDKEINTIPEPVQDSIPAITPAYSVVGEWFYDGNKENTMEYEVTEYKSDGKFQSTHAVASLSMNDFYNYDGTYNYEELTSKLSCIYIDVSDGRQKRPIYDVKTLDSYTLNLYNSSNNVTEKYCRIIDTYKMNVGESRELKISDANFAGASYNTNNPYVVTVSASGSVKALKRGVAYISVKSSIGTAVIRVVVTDKENYFDDFMLQLGELVDVTIDTYGNIFVDIPQDSGDLMRDYPVFDELIQEIGFIYEQDKVIWQISVLFRGNANEDEIKSTLDRKYTYKGLKNGEYVYNAEKYARFVEIIYNPSARTLYYILDEGYDPYKVFDNLINLSPDEVAEFFGSTITNEERERGEFGFYINEHRIFDYVVVQFDNKTNLVTHVFLRVKERITISDIEPWYKQHYVKTNREKLSYMDADSKVFIGFVEGGGKVYVAYLNNIYSSKVNINSPIVGIWTWDYDGKNTVWGNMGYCGGSGTDVGVKHNGEWWGVVDEEGFLSQLSQTHDKTVHGDESMDAYMILTSDGKISRHSANNAVISSGTYVLEEITNNVWKVANLITTAGSILFPYEINSNGNMPSIFEIVYLTDKKLCLVYPDGGDFDALGNWGEATFWHFKKK